MVRKIKITNTLPEISQAVEQVEGILKAAGIKSEQVVKAVLTLEETLVRIAELTQETTVPMQIIVNKGLRRCVLKVSYKGNAISTADLIPSTLHDEELADVYGPEAEGLIRDMVLRASAEQMNCKYSRGVNTVTILVSKSDKALLYDTLSALAFGALAGIIVRNLLNHDIAEWVSGNMFMPLYQMFLTVITMIIAPFIFFSLASSIAGFQDMSTLGRTGSKVFGCYLMTTLLGLLMCIGMFYLVQPGSNCTMELPMPMGEATDTIVLSPIDKLIGIIPTNFVGSFVQNDMLQIMFLAILVGVALGGTGKYSEKLKTAFDALNELFAHVTGLLARLLPIAIFGSTANMAVTLNLESLVTLMSWVVFSLLCVVLQFVLYLILIVVLGKVNPLPFVRKFSPAMITALVTSSSSVTIPTSQECCRKMGIAPRIFSFSIPLGANVNMDGTSLMFSGTALFLANLYGITIEPSALVSLVFTIMLISVALPGVPGAGTACLLMVFAIVGVPAEAFGIVIGLCPLIELVETSLNVAGDGAVTTIVASSEKALDMEKYKSL